MQNDYQILYEVLKDKTLQLEKFWKSTLIQVKNSNNLNTNYFEFNNEAGRSSFGRRINPTLLKSEPVINEKLSQNPFLAASLDNQTDSNEFLLNRPVGKHVNESAWKKLPTPQNIAKVGEVSNTSSIASEFGSAKMEYAVYFKQGIPINQQEMLKKLAAAYDQIVFDEVSVEFASFTESFGIILRILSVGNELFGLNTFSKIVADNFLLKNIPTSHVTGSANIFENPIELFLFSAYWIQGARDKIIQLLPDSLKCFEKNLLLEVVDPSLAQFFKNNFKKEELSLSASGSGTGLSLQSLLPVAYSNQRDSKNFLRDPTSHANQQKIRDLFINLIRHFSTNQLDTSHPNFHRSFGSRVSELMMRVNSENFGWLAHLYIQEYEQAADVRLDRFEERMASRRSMLGSNTTSISSSSTTFSLDQIFFIFLQYADSFRLTRAVEKKTIAMISISLEQANNPHKRSLWPECIRKLRSIIKLLAFCRYKMSETLCVDDVKSELISVEEEDVIIYSWTQDAILNRQLLTLLPLIYEYFTFIGPDAIKSRCSNTVKLLLRYYQVKFECRSKRHKTGNRAKFVLRLCLEDIFRETLNPEFYAECVMSMNILASEDSNEIEEEDDEKRISKPKNKEDVIFARSIDEDDHLPPSVSSVYRSISSQLRGIHVQLNSICMNIGLNSASDSLTKNHNDPNHSNTSNQFDSTPRKVRPVTQVPAADLRQQKIQKQLRQWFWWRYGSQKDLIDSLNSYILEQLLFPQFPISSDRSQSAVMCKNMYRDLICKVLPELLPNFWKEQPELIEIIINLSLENAGKAIKHHFS